MKNRNRIPLGKKIKYMLDEFVSRGFLAQVALLAGTALALTLLFGIVAVWLGKPNYTEGYWTSLMHMIDQGTITGDEVGTDNYFVFMLIVTFIGMAFTSTIIAIVNNAIQDKLNELKKGHSGVVEQDHLVVLGFDENTYTICREVVEGNRLVGERVCLVVADDLPREEMEHSTKEFRGGHGQFFEKSSQQREKEKNIRIIFRSGDPVSENTFSICAVEHAKAVVINRENDLETIRILLALIAYLKKKHAYLSDEQMPSVVALIHEKNNLTAAKVAAGISFGNSSENRTPNDYRIRVMYSREILGRLFAQACVNQGLPFVMDGLFNYRGASIRLEKGDGTESGTGNPFLGKNLAEITSMVSGSIPMGFVRKSEKKTAEILLGPSAEVRYSEADRLIYLSESPALVLKEREKVPPVGVAVSGKPEVLKRKRNFLLIGRTETLGGMLKIVNGRCTEGSAVNIISSGTSSLPRTEVGDFSCREFCSEDPYRWENVQKILDENSGWFDQASPEHLTNIILLSEDGTEKNLADEKVTVILLNLRKYLKDRNITDISIISEMRLPKNQMLVQNNSSNDFVVASEITNRMMAQIAEDPRKYYIIEELLKQRSGVIELHPLTDYVDVSQEFNFEGVFCSAAGTGEQKRVIPLGWIRIGREETYPEEQADDRPRLVLAPTKEEREQIYPGGTYSNYRLVVLA